MAIVPIDLFLYAVSDQLQTELLFFNQSDNEESNPFAKFISGDLDSLTKKEREEEYAKAYEKAAILENKRQLLLSAVYLSPSIMIGSFKSETYALKHFENIFDGVEQTEQMWSQLQNFYIELADNKFLSKERLRDFIINNSGKKFVALRN